MKSDPNASPPEEMEADRLLDLVGDALELPPDERAAFLKAACGDDLALLTEAASLVEHGHQADGFLGQPAYAQAGCEDLGGVEAGSLAPGIMLGENRLLSLLGEGGMGEVYLAEDTKLERRVAVKLLKHRLDDASLARRFRHERKVLAALNHPNIARLYGGGTTPEGRSYLVMEYVEGQRLDRFCDTHALGVAGRLALFRKVCAAVAYAHQNLVVHRDLKPANILVTPEGEPKLLDFGIAKLLDPEDGTGTAADPTVTLHAAMTPEYASPEQLRGETITTSSDVYSLGVVLYELLCGQRPFAALKSRRPDELVRAICEQDPPRPSTIAGETAPPSRTDTVSGGQTVPTPREAPARLRRLLAGDLDNIVAKALRKEPGRRYPGASALSEDVRRHCEGLPVSARRDTVGYRAGKFVRRNQVGVAAALLVLLALCGGLIATAWQARVAGQERDRARSAQRQSERLNSFLESLLGSVDPAKMGKDVKVSQVLDDASAKLDLELADEPEILAQAHETLRIDYNHLGLFEPAESHARAALALVRRLHGADDPLTARAERNLADILNNRYHYQEAEPLLLHALAVERRQHTPDHAVLAKLLSSLGYNAYQQRRPDEAARYAQEALDHARLVWNEKSADYLRILRDLGTVQVARHDYVAAEATVRRVLALQDQITPIGIDTLPTLLNLNICLFNQDKLVEMRPVVDRAEQDSRRLVGGRGMPFALATVCRGCLDFAEGHYRQAIDSIQTGLPILTANYPPGQITVVQCRGLLGLSLTRSGHPTEGEPFLRTAIADGGAVDRVEFAHTFGDLEAALGECLLAQGRYADAEPWLLTAHQDLEKRLGNGNRMTVSTDRLLHDLYTAWNKPAEAARYASDAMSTQISTAR